MFGDAPVARRQLIDLRGQFCDATAYERALGITRCRPNALTLLFWLVTSHIARTHSVMERQLVMHELNSLF